MMIKISNVVGLAQNEDKIRALNNILMACGEGKHVLWMPAKLADQIIQENIISGYQLNVLYFVREQSRLTKAHLDQLDFYVDVGFDEPVPIGFIAPRTFRLSYDYFVDSARVQLPVFVCENITDIDFYVMSGMVFLNNSKLLKEYALKFLKVGGGGNTTICSFENHLRNHSLVICILDSDKSHPNALVKETALRFDAYEKGWGQRYWLHILDCTEAENLVPMRIAEEALHQVGANAALQKFKALTPEARQFLDHKEGLRFSAALDIDRTLNAPHWSTLYEEDDEGDYWISDPLGSSFLDRSVEIMSGMSTKKLAECFDVDLDNQLLSLASMVAAWGIGYKKSIR
ncbi:hypothetical protein [Pseudomonas fluorescens]|uniref:Uncharacterized protein n=1 Tax=Pseudomonas fluorescens TaxID=294 RepID=A0A423ME71_PSEFL|nr:hypothetical protein [Pseudomonas fluorescens]RON81593.1 hypothetical protein BK670_15610 [Pseudomonas fluorescens]